MVTEKANSVKKKNSVKKNKIANESYVDRGRLDTYLTPEIIENWYKINEKTGKRHTGRYSDSTMIFMLKIMKVYNLPYRSTEGLVKSFLESYSFNHLKTPDYSAICLRAGELELDLDLAKTVEKLKKEDMRLAVDASGMKASGVGEWCFKIHQSGKRRKWLKIHVMIDYISGKVVNMRITDSDTHDGEEVIPMLSQLLERGSKITTLYADGAYHWNEIFNFLDKNSIYARIPLPSNAVLSGENSHEAFKATPRDLALLEIYDAGGVEKWKKSTDYHIRSIVENFFYRIKTMFGSTIRAKKIKTQANMAKIMAILANDYLDLDKNIRNPIYT